jgi:putative flippase GtrA
LKQSKIKEVFPRGTIQRFATAGGFNTLIFWISWEIFRVTPIIDFTGETFIWTISWILSSTIAHFVHRWFTFDGRRDIKQTLLRAVSVYSFGLVASTLSYDSFLIVSDLPIRLIFLINMCIWGVFTWAAMRWFVFGYTDEEEE